MRQIRESEAEIGPGEVLDEAQFRALLIAHGRGHLLEGPDRPGDPG